MFLIISAFVGFVSEQTLINSLASIESCGFFIFLQELSLRLQPEAAAIAIGLSGRRPLVISP
jgi:hypothetical protein